MNNQLFKGKTAFITGASRGIGKEIALKLALAGANIVIAAKSVEENPKLGGTIYSTASDIEAIGGKALALQCDIRNEDQVQEAVNSAVAAFGGIDILINNASAISLTSTVDTEMKRYDLMYDINVRGTFLVTKTCIPHLKKSSNAHILTLSPPIGLKPEWLGAHAAYTISKFDMSMLTLAWAAEYKNDHIAANALWPVTTIATAAVQNLLGGDYLMARSRKPAILADAAFYILSKPADTCSGNLFLDEDILRAEGINDFTKYAVNPNLPLHKDLFV